MNATPVEVWKPIAGHEGRYEVSDAGRVRSLDRVVMRNNGRPLKRRGQLLKPFKGDAYDHQVVSLGSRDRHYLHTLVLEAFVGPRPTEGRWEACHNDGNPLNNALSNLRWDTASANQRDRRAHGTHHYGNRTHCKWGHEYTPENTDYRIRTGARYVKPSHTRVCKRCVRDRSTRTLTAKAS